jgi:hypothetical protein
MQQRLRLVSDNAVASRSDPLILLRVMLQWQVVALYAAASAWEGLARTVERELETLRSYR